MKVAKLVEIGRVELFEEPIPKPGPGQLLIQMKAAGICGSDTHYFLQGGLGSFKASLPMAMGHEPAGVVADPCGSKRFKTGDPVAIDPAFACGMCDYCARGMHNLCGRAVFMGSAGASGAFQDYMAVHEEQLMRVEPQIPKEEIALLEPCSVAHHAVRLADLSEGDHVVIFGAGAIGLCLLLATRQAGAGKVFVVDPLAYRLQIARRVFGATDVLLCAKDQDLIRPLKALTDGQGVWVAFDAAGTQESVDGCYQVVAPGGKVVLVGIPPSDFLNYNPHLARIKEVTICNVRRSNRNLETCYDLLCRGKIVLSPMVTHRCRLEDLQRALEVASYYREGVIKAMVTW